ncbi:hypothetical protein HNY73_009410 [Argiope bruennichi]|uniref:Uncharacterized protein n=1 Tax=Argiope bruennichi TaxID=94029 RepID=A0A8T0FAG6_ARGBR|nr:hypothetical protein HNY73_009410 [Argiope bruennichi]
MMVQHHHFHNSSRNRSSRRRHCVGILGMLCCFGVVCVTSLGEEGRGKLVRFYGDAGELNDKEKNRTATADRMALVISKSLNGFTEGEFQSGRMKQQVECFAGVKLVVIKKINCCLSSPSHQVVFPFSPFQNLFFY